MTTPVQGSYPTTPLTPSPTQPSQLNRSDLYAKRAEILDKIDQLLPEKRYTSRYQVPCIPFTYSTTHGFRRTLPDNEYYILPIAVALRTVYNALMALPELLEWAFELDVRETFDQTNQQTLKKLNLTCFTLYQACTSPEHRTTYQSPLPIFQEDYAFTYENKLLFINQLSSWIDQLISQQAHRYAVEAQNILLEFASAPELDEIKPIPPQILLNNPELIPHNTILDIFGYQKAPSGSKLLVDSIDPQHTEFLLTLAQWGYKNLHLFPAETPNYNFIQISPANINYHALKEAGYQIDAKNQTVSYYPLFDENKTRTITLTTPESIQNFNFLAKAQFLIRAGIRKGHAKLTLDQRKVEQARKEEAIRNKQAELEQNTKALEAHKAQLDTQEQHLNSREQALKDLQQRLKQREIQQDHKEKESSKKQTELEQNTKALKERKAQLDTREQHLDARQQALHHLQLELQQRYLNQESTLKTIREERQALEAQQQALQKQIALLEAQQKASPQKTKPSDDSKKFKREIDELEAENLRLQRDIDAKAKRIKELNSELDDLRAADRSTLGRLFSNLTNGGPGSFN